MVLTLYSSRLSVAFVEEEKGDAVGCGGNVRHPQWQIRKLMAVS
jgi:hypothetical protein